MASTTSDTATTPVDLQSEVADLRARVTQLEALVARVEALEAFEGKTTSSLAPNATAAVEPELGGVAADMANLVAIPAPKVASNGEDPFIAVHDLLRRVLSLAARPESDDPEVEEGLFLDFLSMVHTERKGTPMVESSLRQYGWRQLRRNVRIYLRDPDDIGSYDVARRDPMELSPRADRVKLFLRATTRMPAPIGLRRDTSCGNEWRVETTSL